MGKNDDIHAYPPKRPTHACTYKKKKKYKERKKATRLEQHTTWKEKEKRGEFVLLQCERVEKILMVFVSSLGCYISLFLRRRALFRVFLGQKGWGGGFITVANRRWGYIFPFNHSETDLMCRAGTGRWLIVSYVCRTDHCGRRLYVRCVIVYPQRLPLWRVEGLAEPKVSIYMQSIAFHTYRQVRSFFPFFSGPRGWKSTTGHANI